MTEPNDRSGLKIGRFARSGLFPVCKCSSSPAQDVGRDIHVGMIVPNENGTLQDVIRQRLRNLRLAAAGDSARLMAERPVRHRSHQPPG